MKEKREDGRMQAILGEQIVDVPPSPVPPLKDIPCWNEELGLGSHMQAPFNPVFRLKAGRVREIGSDGLQGRKIAIY